MGEIKIISFLQKSRTSNISKFIVNWINFLNKLPNWGTMSTNSIQLASRDLHGLNNWKVFFQVFQRTLWFVKINNNHMLQKCPIYGAYQKMRNDI